MPRIPLPYAQERSAAYSGSIKELDLNPVRVAWHAAWPGGAAINEVAGFATPNVEQCDRIPELDLAFGGAPGTYAITGLWNGAVQTDSILTVAAATVKGNLPFDAITSVVGPDPVNALALFMGDSYCDPPGRLLWTGTGGDVLYRLDGEATMRAVARTMPAQGELVRQFRRFQCITTTLANAHVGW